jgi:hypothetical protein
VASQRQVAVVRATIEVIVRFETRLVGIPADPDGVTGACARSPVGTGDGLISQQGSTAKLEKYAHSVSSK